MSIYSTRLRRDFEGVDRPDDVVRDIKGRIVRLPADKLAELQAAVDAHDEARGEFCVTASRAAFNALQEAARVLVETQTRLGVWQIHPANAGPGIKADDPRIAEDAPPSPDDLLRAILAVWDHPYRDDHTARINDLFDVIEPARAYLERKAAAGV